MNKQIIGNSKRTYDVKDGVDDLLVGSVFKISKGGEVPKVGRRNIEPLVENNNDDFIYVPAIGLYVAKERTLLGEDFYSCQEKLHVENSKMLNLPEFKEFLKYVKVNNPDIYSEITEVRDPWRAEWIDADFKYENKQFFIVYHVFDDKGNIIQKKEELDRNTLFEDRTPGISLEDYLKNSTGQGLPLKSVEEGNLYYWAPMKDNNSVARFNADGDGANLDYYTGSAVRLSNLGVRAAKKEIKNE